MVLRLGEFLYRAGRVISGLLLLDIPATISAYSGFFPRLTNAADTIAIGFACTATACLSWLAGRAMAYVLARITRINGVRVPHLPSERYAVAAATIFSRRRQQ
jgi:hypothetical protein